MQPIYLDYNATTPLDPEVIEAMTPFFRQEFGNPSSSHWYGISPKKAVMRAREQTAALFNCHPREVVFTSGGTEANNHAICGAAELLGERGRHIITTCIEHPATLEPCRHLEKQGFRITCLPVDADGLVSVADVAAAITPETILISVMHANNEVGTVQPISEIAELARSRAILLHTDAAQSTGKIPTDLEALGVDLLSVAGHKLYAPKGVGALVVRSALKLPRFMHGAGQEMGLRAGTENVLGIVGLGKACDVAARDLPGNAARMRKTRDLLAAKLITAGDVKVNGHPGKRLPNTLSISFRGLEANRILEEIGLDVAASAGAACHSDHVEVSHVLKAMGAAIDFAKGTLRFSTGRFTTTVEIEQAAAAVLQAVTKLRGRLKAN